MRGLLDLRLYEYNHLCIISYCQIFLYIKIEKRKLSDATISIRCNKKYRIDSIHTNKSDKTIVQTGCYQKTLRNCLSRKLLSVHERNMQEECQICSQIQKRGGRKLYQLFKKYFFLFLNLTLILNYTLNKFFLVTDRQDIA